MRNNPLVERYGKEHAWVTWRYKEVGGRRTKVPHRANGLLASSTDPDHWDDYASLRKTCDNVGIVFRPSRLLLGIDLDHVLDENRKIVDQSAFDLVAEADTYAEVSPSGTGLHLYLELTSPLDLKSNRKGGYEAYTEGRYFTVTLESFGEMRDVRKVTPEEAEELLAILGYPWKEVEDQQTEKTVGTSSLTDDEILEKIRHAKNGSDVLALMDSKANSEKDMALLSHLAFWTGRDRDQMERMWLATPMAQRKKTQERADYRKRTIDAVLSKSSAVYSPPTSPDNGEGEPLELMTIMSRGKETTIKNTENVRRILSGHADFRGRYRYDAFTDAFEVLKNNRWKVMEDNDAVIAQTEISVLFPNEFGTVGKEMVYDAIVLVAKEAKYDSAIEYVSSLVWDGQSRLDTWLTRTFGPQEDAYHAAVGANWMKGLVKRLVEPGCKFDYVLVLEGEQGTRKSTSLSILGGPWHVETTMSTENKDFFMQFHGKAIVEFSEGETLSRTEVKRMKAIITTQVDKYRAPYSRSSLDYPRRCVFAMTTNQEEYLKDETGNRRWLPVRVTLPQADTDWLKENRDQLYAEAYHRVVSLKETVHEFPYEETLLAQESRRVVDANQDVIVEWYYNLTPVDRNNGITIHKVYKDALNGGFSSRPMDKGTEMRIAEVLRMGLNLERERRRIGGALVNLWVAKGGRKEEATSLDEMMADVRF